MSRRCLALSPAQFVAAQRRAAGAARALEHRPAPQREDKRPRPRQRGVKHGDDYRIFELALVALGAPRPEREHRFHPHRRWRFDLAWVLEGGRGIALEVDGGAFTGGRHTRGAGFREDLAKRRAATLLGWRVLHYLPEELATIAPGEVLALLHQEGIAPSPADRVATTLERRQMVSKNKGKGKAAKGRAEESAADVRPGPNKHRFPAPDHPLVPPTRHIEPAHLHSQHLRRRRMKCLRKMACSRAQRRRSRCGTLHPFRLDLRSFRLGRIGFRPGV